MKYKTVKLCGHEIIIVIMEYVGKDEIHLIGNDFKGSKWLGKITNCGRKKIKKIVTRDRAI